MSLGSSDKPSTVEWTPRPGTAIYAITILTLLDLGDVPGSLAASLSGHSKGHNQHSLLSVGCEEEARPTGG